MAVLVINKYVLLHIIQNGAQSLTGELIVLVFFMVVVYNMHINVL